MRQYDARLLSEWLMLNSLDNGFYTRGTGIETMSGYREETDADGVTSTVPYSETVTVEAETVFSDPLPAETETVLTMGTSVVVYADQPSAGDVTVEFTAPDATADVDIRVYDDDYNVISTATDTFDADGVVGVTLQQPAAGTYHVALWRSDLPPLSADVEVAA